MSQGIEEQLALRGENSRVNVLIVDDSDDQRMLLRTYFERAGCEVVEAGTALDALDFFELRHPDLAVIDLYLPGMDGWQLAAELQSKLPTMPIAITSVLSREHYPAEHAALPKPVTSAHVRSALEELVPWWTAA
jgi:CheY-like chemotaxis protein